MYSIYRCYSSGRTRVHESIPSFQEACEITLGMQQQHQTIGTQFLIFGPSRQGKTRSLHWYKVDATPNGIQISMNEQATPLLSKVATGGGQKISGLARDREFEVFRLQAGKKSELIEAFRSRERAAQRASELQKRATDPHIRYCVKSGGRSLPEYRLQGQAQPGRSIARHQGVKYSVVCVKGGETNVIKEGFHSEDAACECALLLQEQAADPAISYYVEYTPVSTRSGSKSKRRNREIPYRSRELLGLGIPAQTGHGRRSRKGFNDPT